MKIKSPTLRLSFGPAVPLSMMSAIVKMIEAALLAHGLADVADKCTVTNDGTTLRLAGPDGSPVWSGSFAKGGL